MKRAPVKRREIEPEKIEVVVRCIPAGWHDTASLTRARRMAEMEHRPGKWWSKVCWQAKQRKHKGFRRACLYLLELRAVCGAEDFLRRLAEFRRAQRRRRDLIVFLNEAGLTVPGEPIAWEELIAAHPLKVRRQNLHDGLSEPFLPFEGDEPVLELDEWDDEIPF